MYCCVSLKEKWCAKRLFVSVNVAALANISEIRKTQIVDAKTGPFAHAGYYLYFRRSLVERLSPDLKNHNFSLFGFSLIIGFRNTYFFERSTPRIRAQTLAQTSLPGRHSLFSLFTNYMFPIFLSLIITQFQTYVSIFSIILSNPFSSSKYVSLRFN